MTADPSYSTSVEVTRTLTEALTKGDPEAFDLEEYSKVGRAAKEVAVTLKETAQGEELEDILVGMSAGDRRRTRRSAETGGWMAAMPIRLNGTVLSPLEFRDNLALRFGYLPANLPKLCDGCGEVFTVAHAMACKKGGLVHQRHDGYAGEFGCFLEAGLTPSAVRNEPIIKTGCARAGGEGSNEDDAAELRGDISAFGFWGRGKTAVFDVRIVDTDHAQG